MANTTAFYFHFRNDRDETETAQERLASLKATLLGWSFDDSGLTTPVADYLPARRNRELGKLKSPSVWFCHITPLLSDNRLGQLIEASFGEGISQRFVLLVSGQAITDSDWIKTSINAAKAKGFGGFTYLPVGLDDVDKTELKAILFRIHALFEEHEKASTSPSPEAFEGAIHPPPADFVHETTERLVQCTTFDKNRHGRFAAKLLDRFRLEKTIVEGLKHDECVVLADFITHLAEFEDCRSRLSHSTLNQLVLRLRKIHNVLTNPKEYPLENDPDCVSRLMDLVKQDDSERSLHVDSQRMIDKATAISKSTAIRDVVLKLRGEPGNADGATVAFFREKCLRNIEDGWNELKAMLADFPKFKVDDSNNKVDKAKQWLNEVQPESLESARSWADTYQLALAPDHFYEERQ